MAGGDSAPLAVAGGYQLAYVLAAACVATGLAVVLVFLRSPALRVEQRRAVRVEAEEAA